MKTGHPRMSDAPRVAVECESNSAENVSARRHTGFDRKAFVRTLLFVGKKTMSNSALTKIAASGLVIGAVLGMAGTFAPSASLRGLAWGIDGTAIIVGAAILVIHHARKGNDLAAAG